MFWKGVNLPFASLLWHCLHFVLQLCLVLLKATQIQIILCALIRLVCALRRLDCMTAHLCLPPFLKLTATEMLFIEMVLLEGKIKHIFQFLLHQICNMLLFCLLIKTFDIYGMLHFFFLVEFYLLWTSGELELVYA